jgi:hypothetical protein
MNTPRTIADAKASDRELQLLVIIVRSLGDVTSRLSDLATLIQQQVDLLRRIVHKEHAP